jgi:DNA mismatch repair protein MutL
MPASAPPAPPAPPPIRRLDPLVVDQIAAGEVVERPASVVKELVENALDAGASRIAVELEAGGIERIAVTDDGCGMPQGELHLAVAQHATSKIARGEDLARIATMGFRGEALASIAAVSRLEIRTRSASQPHAAQIVVEGGAVSPPAPAAGPVGTRVSARRLFYNTPARRRFLRTAPAEAARCRDVLLDLALGSPAVAFTLRQDARTVLDLPRASPRDRALAVLGPELETQVLEVTSAALVDAGGVSLWGLAGLPSIARATGRSQHVLLNARPIRDRTIQHAIREAYRGLIEPARDPTAVLLIDMDPGVFDVNVHPAKLEVRFRDPSLVHSVVHGSIRDALRQADLTPGFTPSPRSPGASPGEVLSGARRASMDIDRFMEHIRRGQTPGPSYEALRSALEGAPPGPAPLPDSPLPALLPAPRPAERILQVHNSYLVTEDAEGVVIIDQHALHERVMFEALSARLAKGSLESQALLAPVVFQAPASAVEGLARLEPLLQRLGIDARAMGPGSIGVHAFPAFLADRGVDPADLLRDLLDLAQGDQPEPGSEDALRRVLSMMACKAAVRAGDALSSTELESLVALRNEVERASACPHGRPTSVRLTLRDLERLFHRR